MKILIVDADADYASTLAASLRLRSHDVELRSSAFGISNRVAGRDQGNRPAVVILDYQLPGLSAESLLQILGKDPKAFHVPVILHSALDPNVLDHAVRHHPLAITVSKDGRPTLVMDTVSFLARSISANALPVA